jgi:hypothetical protein
MDLRELFGSDAPPVDVTALAYDNPWDGVLLRARDDPRRARVRA